jgi:ribosome-binding protein aMBF1 (putative translation factor)
VRYCGGIGNERPAEGIPAGGDREGAPSATVFPGFNSLAEDADALIVDLVARRRERGLSQAEVAKRMGTSQSALARVESGRSDLRLSTVARYAAALDVDIAFAVRPRQNRKRPRGADPAT